MRRCAFAHRRARDRRSICLRGSGDRRGRRHDVHAAAATTRCTCRATARRIAPAPDGCDLAEVAAPVTSRHPVQFVRFGDVQSRPGLHFAAGGPSAKRELNVLIGKNVQAGRIMAGVTFSEPGNWTSWPPHEHAVLLEEAYLYIDMPAPAFGVQLVYTDAHEPELATIVREGDVVLMPQGYHPNVAAPGGSINFLWMMAAHARGRGPPVRRRQRPAGIRRHAARAWTRADAEQADEQPPNPSSTFQHRDWAAIPVERIADGIERQMIWGERLMVCRLRFAPHTVTAVHSHPHEQITSSSAAGRVHDRRPEAGRVEPATCCTSRRTCAHGATMLDEEVVLIDIFSPVREDFLPETPTASAGERAMPACRSICSGSTARWRS